MDEEVEIQGRGDKTSVQSMQDSCCRDTRRKSSTSSSE